MFPCTPTQLTPIGLPIKWPPTIASRDRSGRLDAEVIGTRAPIRLNRCRSSPNSCKPSPAIVVAMPVPATRFEVEDPHHARTESSSMELRQSEIPKCRSRSPNRSDAEALGRHETKAIPTPSCQRVPRLDVATGSLPSNAARFACPNSLKIVDGVT